MTVCDSVSLFVYYDKPYATCGSDRKVLKIQIYIRNQTTGQLKAFQPYNSKRCDVAYPSRNEAKLRQVVNDS